MPFTCRSCDSPDTEPVLSLGETPLANALLREDQLEAPEPTFPLEVVFCPSCSLLQITETVPAELLFGEYVYASSFSDTAVANARGAVEARVGELSLGADSLAVEVASNDGYLLQFYVEAGIPVLGIEPARNIAQVATQRGIRTRCAFFGDELAGELVQEGLRADVLHANNVLAHVSPLNGFVAGIARLLAPEGVACVEVPYVRDLVDHLEFDTIYHEHLCYFSVTALVNLLGRHGLTVFDVERIPIHGGSLRVLASPGSRARSARLERLLEEESSLGVDGLAYYQALAERVAGFQADLRELLSRLKAEGSSIAVYGASAKGSTLLNTCGIGSGELDFVVDRSTLKQGSYTPGTRLPILPPEELLVRKPDYVLLLTWNFKDEILAQQEEYRRGGGRFIVPLPKLEVL